jgi:hypothetical protein
MKNLVMGALLGAAASLTACTAAPTDAVITANWRFQHFSGGVVSGDDPCPPGFTTTSIHSKPWDPIANVTFGTEVIDKFLCSDKSGTTDPLDGIFLVWVQIETDNGGSIYAQSERNYIDTADGDTTINLPMLDNAGFFFLTWDLANASNNAPMTCEQAGVGRAGSVETHATLVGTTALLTDKFTCNHYYGTTEPLPVGTYTVSVDADDGTGSIGTAPAIINQHITAPTGLTDLGHIVIPVTP